MNSPASSVLLPSLRDPAGRLYGVQGRLIRIIHKSWVPHVQAFLNSRALREFTDSGRFVRTRVLSAPEFEPLLQTPDIRVSLETTEVGMVAEHEPVWFPSFPYEWPPEMLHAAGQLTLDLAAALLDEGLGIKDATPYNILFQGPQPLFIDLLSGERRDPQDPIWLPFGQFVRTFLLPLLAYRTLRISPDQVLLTHRDGLEPAELYKWCNRLQRLLPPTLTLCTIPTWLESPADSAKTSLYQGKRVQDAARARFILDGLLKRQRRLLDRLEPVRRNDSYWSDYMATQPSYTQQEFASKESFVREALLQFRPQRVLDIGCNIGHFSKAAAQSGASVIAIDSDPQVVGEVWRRARAERLDILPLVVDLSRPTPAVGWRNREHPSFLERACQAFDGVLLLAVIHHLLVTAGIPLREILRLASELTTHLCVAEFVGPADPMFRRLLRGREHLYEDLSIRTFEAACDPHFEILRSIRLASSERWLYLLQRKS